MEQRITELNKEIETLVAQYNQHQKEAQSIANQVLAKQGAIEELKKLLEGQKIIVPSAFTKIKK